MLKRILEMSKIFAEEVINEGDIAIDATVGNGNDTLFLLKQENLEEIYGFDIQKDAINTTKNKIETYQNNQKVTLILDGHENVKNYVKVPVKVALFNLGYLPNGDKSITTLSETTLQAIENILDLLEKGGRIILTIYHGHENGKVERDAIQDYARSLNQKDFNVLQYQFINQVNHAPFLIIIEKK